MADARLRSALLEHPDFANKIDLILFEGASGLHQALLDRFVLEGADFSRAELQFIWQDAGRGVLWQLPIYEQFFRDVRQLNLRLPGKERIRMVGAAVPIPWPQIETAQDLLPWLDRMTHHREQIRREVLEPGRRALAVFGKLHCEKGGGQLAASLSQEAPGSVWSAFSFTRPDAARRARERLSLGRQPSLLLMTDSPHALQPAGDAFFELHKYNGALLGEVADAIISYGEQDYSILAIDEDALNLEFRQELLRRDRLRAAATSLESVK